MENIDFSRSMPSQMSKARNGFIVFLHYFKRDLEMRGLTGFAINQLSELANERWQNMTPEEKQPFLELAKLNRQIAMETILEEDANNTPKPEQPQLREILEAPIIKVVQNIQHQNNVVRKSTNCIECIGSRIRRCTYHTRCEGSMDTQSPRATEVNDVGASSVATGRAALGEHGQVGDSGNGLRVEEMAEAFDEAPKPNKLRGATKSISKPNLKPILQKYNR